MSGLSLDRAGSLTVTSPYADQVTLAECKRSPSEHGGGAPGTFGQLLDLSLGRGRWPIPRGSKGGRDRAGGRREHRERVAETANGGLSGTSRAAGWMLGLGHPAGHRLGGRHESACTAA